MAFRVISAGAAKGLVSDLQREFEHVNSVAVEGLFSAVGAIRETFLAGDPCDVIILTSSQIDELVQQGLLLHGSAAPLGTVRTGIAVPNGQSVPDISTRASLTATIRAAEAIYVSDPQRSTAGIHFRQVLERLGIEPDIRAKLRAFPNGETAMRTFADDALPGAIGCTQITEIIYTSGLTLVGALPAEYGLSTVYAACVSAKASHPDLAREFVTLLTGARSLELRGVSGFET